MSMMIRRYRSGGGSPRTIRPVAVASPRGEHAASMRFEPGGLPGAALPALGGAAPAASEDVPLEMPGYTLRKSRYPAVLWMALMVSAGLHWAVFRLFPTIHTEVESHAAPELVAIRMAPPEVEIPPAPGRIVRPGAPVISDGWVSEEITILASTFEDFAPREPMPSLPLPPPIPEAKPEAWADQPTFTPYTIAPVLRNPEEAEREILERYPRTMRAAGAGGTVTLWFYLDETGKVLRTLVATSSGDEALDEAAAGVAAVLEFTPAYNRDSAVKVWVQMPIMFTVRR